MGKATRYSESSFALRISSLRTNTAYTLSCVSAYHLRTLPECRKRFCKAKQCKQRELQRLRLEMAGKTDNIRHCSKESG